MILHGREVRCFTPVFWLMDMTLILAPSFFFRNVQALAFIFRRLSKQSASSQVHYENVSSKYLCRWGDLPGYFAEPVESNLWHFGHFDIHSVFIDRSKPKFTSKLRGLKALCGKQRRIQPQSESSRRGKLEGMTRWSNIGFFHIWCFRQLWQIARCGVCEKNNSGHADFRLSVHISVQDGDSDFLCWTVIWTEFCL